MNKKYVVLKGDPKNKPNEEYLYITETQTSNTLFEIIFKDFLGDKRSIYITKDEIQFLADWVKNPV